MVKGSSHPDAAVQLIHRMRAVLPLLLALLAGAGCHDATGELQVQFPSTAAFLASASAEVSIYDAEQDIQICRKLADGTSIDQQPLLTSGSIDVCDLQGASSVVEPLGSGVFAAYVTVMGKGTAPILSGCTTFAVSEQPLPVTVELAATLAYDANMMAPTASSVSDRCGGQ
jgi:hypothetical protein